MAQGSVLAPILYTIYTSDFPAMLATRYMYTDDVALKVSANMTSKIERSLSVDMQTISKYLKNGDTKYLLQKQCVPSSIWGATWQNIKFKLSSMKITWDMRPNQLT